jgi:hypothetical protein
MSIPSIKKAGKIMYVKMPMYGLGVLRLKLSNKKRRIITMLIRTMRPPK